MADLNRALAVALLAEGVDRNGAMGNKLLGGGESPSSRRAWIEIMSMRPITSTAAVALLAEGVDRNGEVFLCRSPLDGRPPRGGRG